MRGTPKAGRTRLGRALSFSLAAVASAGLAGPVMADYISPNIKDRGHDYSREKPNSAFFGTGQGGRYTEASQLRIEADYAIQERDFDLAERKARKAVQLDPGYPEGHLIFARALTGKFYRQEGEINEKLLHELIREWRIIQLHDADVSDQWEAGAHLKKFTKISKALEKDRMAKMKRDLEKKQMELALAKEKQRNAKKQEPGQKQAVAAAGAAESVTAEVETPGHFTHTQVGDPSAAKVAPEAKLAEKKKRFLLF